jgi:Xaa-Pro aminopeptidase
MPQDETTQRLQSLISQLEEHKLDCLVVSSLVNIRYLTGFTGSNALLVATRAGATLFTDPRYRTQAREQVSCQVKVAKGPLLPALSAYLRGTARVWSGRKRGASARAIGFERNRISFVDYEMLKENLALGASAVPVAGLVETLRMIKSESEIAAIRRSVTATSQAFAASMARCKAEMSESDLAAELEYQMRRFGAEKPAFDTIVASGPRTALPHAQPTPETLGRNRLLLIDMGAMRDGYASDMTRMASLGRPGNDARRLYGAVLDAQLEAIAAVREGVTAGAVDRKARLVLRAGKLDRAFVHATGHGLGLEIHEAPRLGKREKTPLQAGMVITIEPGAYLPGFGGVRIEDTVLVTRQGCEVLTPTSKDLLVL